MKSLYETPLGATRSGALFLAHSYPTKISPESIALMIACHTKPGALVFDGFGGSCTTALAALLCAQPSAELSATAKALGLNPVWGPRRAVVYELSGLGSFIGQTFCSQPEPDKFFEAANRVLDAAQRRYGWMYGTLDEDGAEAVARHFIWSELLECAACHETETFWNACVRLNPARMDDRWKCRACGKTAAVNATSKVSESGFDPLLGTKLRARRDDLRALMGLRDDDTGLVSRLIGIWL